MQTKATAQTQRLGKDAGFLTVRATGSLGSWASGRRRSQASGLRGAAGRGCGHQLWRPVGAQIQLQSHTEAQCSWLLVKKPQPGPAPLIEDPDDSPRRRGLCSDITQANTERYVVAT